MKQLNRLKLVMPFLTMGLLLIPVFVFAKGGGGGGTVETPPPAEPTCSEDTWSCTSFSACGLNGTQTRTCTLTNDCSSANTPKPSETQSCTPSCTADTWTCSEFSACSNSSQSRTCSLTFDCPLTNDAKPNETQSCVEEVKEEPVVQEETKEEPTPEPVKEVTPEPELIAEPVKTNTCTEDVYECTDFSQCREDGTQARSCVLKTDCPGVNTPAPTESQVCLGLQCGQLETLNSRIECRLKLSKQQLANEFDVLYFPEYCKTGGTDEWKQSCISLYRSFGPCWQKLPGADRAQCAKQVLKISSFQEEKQSCLAKTGSALTSCKSDLSSKVKNYVLFNLYELSFKAEMLLSKGKVSVSQVAAIETIIETKKAELNELNSVSEWKSVVISMKAEWKKFVGNIKN